MPRIKVPAALTGGASAETVEVAGTTVGDVLDNHAEAYGPALRDSVVANDEIKEFINIFVDGEEVQALDEPVEEASLIRIMPAASGGQGEVK